MKDKSQISEWWAENPQTYGIVHGKTKYGEDEHEVEFASAEFFQNADKVFNDWNKPLKKDFPFDRIFSYEKYKNLKVLEIGCGMGYMSSLWACRGADITAVDLNPVSISTTGKRFELFHLKGTIQQEDANKLSFPDSNFDYVYSWGVLHHSPDLELSISELFRVLKPGGEFGVMLYNRSSLLQYYDVYFKEGFLHRENKFLNKLQLSSRYSDGYMLEGNPHTWPLKRKELQKIFSPYCKSLDIRLLGTDLDFLFVNTLLGLNLILPKFIIKSWSRRFGWSWWISGEKKK